MSCAMPIGRKDAERGLELLWEFRSKTDDPIQRSAYEQAIASLHAFLTDVLPASQPCIRTKVKDGFLELHPTQEAPVQVFELKCVGNEKIGLCLDRVNGWGADEVSSIVISLVKPGSVAARDSTLKRGDQVIELNGHSLAQVSLERARYTPPPPPPLFSPFPSLSPPFLLPPSPSSLLPPFCVLVDFSWCTAGASCVQEKEHIEARKSTFIPTFSFCILHTFVGG